MDHQLGLYSVVVATDIEMVDTTTQILDIVMVDSCVALAVGRKLVEVHVLVPWLVIVFLNVEVLSTTCVLVTAAAALV